MVNFLPIFTVIGICIVILIMLLRYLPRLRYVWLALFAIVWTTIVIGIAYPLGGLTSTGRGNSAIRQLLRDTNRALEAGDCENTRAAFQEANRFVESGGRDSLYDAAKLISERLRPPTAAPVIPAQPE